MSEPYIGQIIMFGGNFAIRGYATCDGQLLSIAQNTALFSILGTTFGGNGQTTFGLPDLRGRVPLHMGGGPGLTPRTVGERSGEEAHTLIQSEIPAHTHAVQANAYNGAGNTNVAAGNVWSKDAGVQSATYSTNPANAPMSQSALTAGIAGGSQPHNIMQPYLCVNFLIALQGIFPSRN